MPQPLMAALLLLGLTVMPEMEGTTLAGAVIVKLCVDVPSRLPLASSVSRVAEAVPLVADGMALSQFKGMVYDTLETPAATDCTLL